MTDNEDNEKLPSWVHKNGQIIDRKLFEFLNPSSRIVRIRTVKTPMAQTNTLCNLPTSTKQQFDTLLLLLANIKMKEPIMYYLCEIMLAGSCRVSEVLAINYSDFKTTKQLLIRGKKGSGNRLISISESRIYLEKCKENKVNPFAHFDRFYVYRQFKKYGIGGQFDGSQKMAITHYFRQLSLRILQMEGVNQEDRMKQAGHKSKSSTKYYETN
jgi:integrase